MVEQKKNSYRKKKIWIDLDNSPHVLFFNPIIKELKQRGFDVVVTARDYAQVIGLADMFNLEYTRMGIHYGKHKIFKALGLLIRSLQLIPFALKEKPDLAFSHGSRSHVISGKMTGIPVVVAFDYEHAKPVPFFRPNLYIVPEILVKNELNRRIKRILGYPGIKEDVYVQELIPDSAILKSLGIKNGDVVVTIRPPATAAHYRNTKSDELFQAVIEFLVSKENCRIIMLPRTEEQGKAIRHKWRQYFGNGKIKMPNGIVEGLNLIWHSDLVISGGGTIIREAAALGVPAYSIFGGKIGAVDQFLSESGRLTLIKNVNDLGKKLKVVKRTKPESPRHRTKPALRIILNNLTEIINN